MQANDKSCKYLFCVLIDLLYLCCASVWCLHRLGEQHECGEESRQLGAFRGRIQARGACVLHQAYPDRNHGGSVGDGRNESRAFVGSSAQHSATCSASCCGCDAEHDEDKSCVSSVTTTTTTTTTITVIVIKAAATIEDDYAVAIESEHSVRMEESRVASLGCRNGRSRGIR